MDVKRTIDINCDLGEGMPNDAELMPYISSCNIACGGHVGDKETIRAAIRLAKKHKVNVGAHPSYPDPDNFGRRSMNISSSALKESLIKQLLDFLSICDEEEVSPNHIKLHGALYNDTVKDKQLSNLITELFHEMNLTLPLYASQSSHLVQTWSPVLVEAFVDRRYNHDGSLVSRSHSEALIQTPSEAWKQLEGLYFNHEVMTIRGKVIPLKANTFCVHGDTPNAMEILQFIHQKLESLNIHLDTND